jgi:hypothetical protein
MAQVIEHLHSKHKTLSSNPILQKEKRKKYILHCDLVHSHTPETKMSSVRVFTITTCFVIYFFSSVYSLLTKWVSNPVNRLHYSTEILSYPSMNEWSCHL